jgi:hypothetical protein
MIVNNMHNGS